MLRFFLFLVALPVVVQAAPFTVVIDPGHGGRHDGAVSPEGIKEKDVVLSVAHALRTLLEKDGDVRVVLTREGDEDLPLVDRPALANALGADIFVSLHCNSMPTAALRKRVTGIETYFLSADASDAEAHALAARENADGQLDEAPVEFDPIAAILDDLSRTLAHADAGLFASHLHRALTGALDTKDRGVRQAPFVVLLGARMPAVLVEIGFLSHPTEGRKLADAAHQAVVAEALREGIREFRSRVFARRVAPQGVVPASDVAVTP